MLVDTYFTPCDKSLRTLHVFRHFCAQTIITFVLPTIFTQFFFDHLLILSIIKEMTNLHRIEKKILKINVLCDLPCF